MSDLPAIDFSRLGPAAGARIAVVGGCGGMGRALVRALLDTGVEVAVLDLPTSIEQHAPPAGVVVSAIDGSKEDSVVSAFADLEWQWGHLDGFVNLAGFMKGFHPIAELPVAIFDEVLAGNLRNQFLCARAALPLLHKGKQAAMVNVTSTLGLDVYGGYVHYSTAKAGIVALTKGLARENAPRVRVNALAPGLTDTAFLVGGTGREKVFDDMDPTLYAKRVPLKRVAVAADMVGPILFMLGAASRYMTGETMIVDGGTYVQ
ncbi:SDR family oxidoreductase [Methylocella sp. CPCC 101449]|uniref:SDR family NAD(P)-dependent oxidoreductase n=1 Tax=Methylocella sp. CPCC 101449 TaxID=2987531 RepID=UPI00288D7D7F|nr:SDR family oxidoreductase [Methylocella sp. CPCC 101449]MDT2024255.1 SDR family oxidoreductase [Methylocella sp. CPCC 101449]